MARTLSDALIIAMIESATRLAGGRGPVTGPSPQALAESGGAAIEVKPENEAKVETATPAAPGEASSTTSPPSANGAPPAEHDSRSAEQIAADFKAIYSQIEVLVRVSAEQETTRVGFGIH